MEPRKKKYHSNIHKMLRAEVFGAGLISCGLSFDSLVTKHLGAFKRSFRNDIDKVEVVYDEVAHSYETSIAINRDSLYDRLPEGLFHQSRGSGKTQTVGDMTAEFRRFKEEERNARLFFQPLEQEFFKYGCMAELEEQELCLGMLGANLKNDLHEFWDVGEGLPPDAANVLGRLMPWVSDIKGNMGLCSKALGLTIGKPVRVEEKIIPYQSAGSTLFRLGDVELGVDTVTGKDFVEPSVTWAFTIMEMSKAEIGQYVTNMPFGNLLQQFEEIFIPLDIDTSFGFELKKDEEATGFDILGYGMTI